MVTPETSQSFLKLESTYREWAAVTAAISITSQSFLKLESTYRLGCSYSTRRYTRVAILPETGIDIPRLELQISGLKIGVAILPETGIDIPPGSSRRSFHNHPSQSFLKLESTYRSRRALRTTKTFTVAILPETGIDIPLNAIYLDGATPVVAILPETGIDIPLNAIYLDGATPVVAILPETGIDIPPIWFVIWLLNFSVAILPETGIDIPQYYQEQS